MQAGEELAGIDGDTERSMLTWTVLPVWKAHHTKMAEKQMTSLWDTVSRGCAELEREHAHEPGHETIRRQREC